MSVAPPQFKQYIDLEGAGAAVKLGAERARFPTTFTRLNYSVSKRNSSSCRSGCGLWRGELRRELADEYDAYIRDTGLADYRATPGNLGAPIAVRDLDDDRAEVITLSWWPSMAAIRGFAGDDVERAA